MYIDAIMKANHPHTTKERFPTDVASLQAIILQQQETIIKQQEIIIKQQARIDELEKKIDELTGKQDSLLSQLSILLRHRFGQRSEKLGTEELSDEDDESTSDGEDEDGNAEFETITYTRQKKRNGRAPLPPKLRRVRREYQLENLLCDCGCGATLRKITEEITEQLECIPAEFYVIQHVRFKYAGCKQGDRVITAPMPLQPIDKCLAGPSLLADVLIKKYDDHLPLYRQSEILARHGVDISRKTLCDWVGHCALALEPIVEAMIIDLLKAPKIHTDDTTVPVLDPGAGKTKTGRFWVYHGLGKGTPPIVIYDYSPNRNQEWPMQFLKGYCGYLQADAYGGYDVLYDKKNKDYKIIEVGCWAHVRRKFFDIIQANKKTKKKSGLVYEAVKFIRQLYEVEHEAKEMTDEERKALRQKKATPILEKIKAWLDENHPKLPPKGALAKAMQYALNQWGALIQYLEEGYLDIDNNRAERLIKPVTIGRKNWTFAGSDQGGKNAAIIYSLIETAKLNGLNPQHYLEDVLRRLPTQLMKDIHELLPYNWKPQTNIGAPDTS